MREPARYCGGMEDPALRRVHLPPTVDRDRVLHCLHHVYNALRSRISGHYDFNQLRQATGNDLDMCNKLKTGPNPAAKHYFRLGCGDWTRALAESTNGRVGAGDARRRRRRYRVYFTLLGGQLLAVSTASGSLRWSVTEGVGFRTGISPPVADEARLFMSASSKGRVIELCHKVAREKYRA